MPNRNHNNPVNLTLLATGLLAVSACAPMPLSEAPRGPEPPNNVAAPLPRPLSYDPDIVDRYARTEANLLARGLLRTDAGGSGTDPDRLTQNFMRIALYDEYTEIGGRIVAREQASTLRRWEDPVRIQLRFGASVPAAMREEDRQTVAQLTTRLQTVSGHPLSIVSRAPNFEVFVVNEAERQALGPVLTGSIPGLSDPVLSQITDMPQSIYCLIVAFSDPAQPAIYTRAIAIIRAELPALLRRSCYHEEITQGLGLANDSPTVRPSLFNDDKEFALLTGQDEQMLTILYDPRLRPGMSLTEVRPIAGQIASELLQRPARATDPQPDNQPQET